MTVAHIYGVDPGLVHTGVVRLSFKPGLKTVEVDHHLVPGLDAKAVADLINTHPGAVVFIEKYAPRQSLDSDVRMVQGEQDLRRELPKARFLRNTAITKVVSQRLMEVMRVWSFSTPTHHQDLRSAARIALLGMMKEPRLNSLLSDVVQAHIDGNPWTVRHV